MRWLAPMRTLLLASLALFGVAAGLGAPQESSVTGPAVVAPTAPAQPGAPSDGTTLQGALAVIACVPSSRLPLDALRSDGCPAWPALVDVGPADGHHRSVDRPPIHD